MFATEHRPFVLHPTMNHHSFRQLLSTLTLALSASAVAAQEIIPQEDLGKVVPQLISRASDFDNLPLKTEVDGAKAFGMKAKQYAAVVIPDKRLTRETIAKAGKDIQPVGQLWLAKLTPAVNESATPDDKLRLVTITVKEEDHKVPLLLLGVRKDGEKGLELVIYAKGKEPLVTLPLKKIEAGQDESVTFDMRQGTATLGLIDLKLLGLYEATLPVAEREQ